MMRGIKARSCDHHSNITIATARAAPVVTCTPAFATKCSHGWLMFQKIMSPVGTAINRKPTNRREKRILRMRSMLRS